MKVSSYSEQSLNKLKNQILRSDLLHLSVKIIFGDNFVFPNNIYRAIISGNYENMLDMTSPFYQIATEPTIPMDG